MAVPADDGQSPVDASPAASKPKKRRIRVRESNTLRSRLSRWQSFSINAQPLKELLPEVVSNLAAFDAAVAEVAAAMAEQDVLASQMRALVRRRNEAVRRATDMRIRLAGQIKGAFGDSSEQLHQFGMKPIRRRRALPPRIRLPDPR
jgi:hypothetical protein